MLPDGEAIAQGTVPRTGGGLSEKKSADPFLLRINQTSPLMELWF